MLVTVVLAWTLLALLLSWDHVLHRAPAAAMLMPHNNASTVAVSHHAPVLTARLHNKVTIVLDFSF